MRVTDQGEMSAELHLFYREDSTSCQAARAYLAQLWEKHPGLIEKIEWIDVERTPERTEGLGIIATPTLLIVSPPPPRRLIGSMEGLESLLGFSVGEN